MDLNDPGLVRILDNLESGLQDLHKDIKAVEAKLDVYAKESVTRTEFDAYKDLRRHTTRWAVGIILSFFLGMAGWAAVIIATRPDLFVP